jgi:hypothetical protein
MANKMVLQKNNALLDTNFIIHYIILHLNSILCSDSQTSNYTLAVTEHQPHKCFSKTTSDYGKGGVFCTVRTETLQTRFQIYLS